jgi:DNA mismatch repair protein MutL
MGFDLSDLGGGSFAVNGVPADAEGIDPIVLLRQMVADAVDSDGAAPFAPVSGGSSAGSSLVSGGLPAGGSPVSGGLPDGSAVPASPLHHVLALSLASSAAIPYGQVLSNDEMETLVNHLFACSDVNHTPDGHLILSILSQETIDKLFS